LTKFGLGESRNTLERVAEKAAVGYFPLGTNSWIWRVGVNSWHLGIYGQTLAS